MADVKKIQTLVSASVSMTLDEEEIRALDALAGYGVDSALKAFYKNCGTDYLKPYEAGLRRFLESVRNIASFCRDAQECREFLQMSREDYVRREHARLSKL